VLLANKKTNRPARSDSPDASTPSKPRVPQRLPKGTAEVIKLANRYSSLKEMLGMANETIPKTSKQAHKRSVPWFNDSCKMAVAERKKSLHAFTFEQKLAELFN